MGKETISKMFSEKRKKVVIENFFKSECDINTSIHDAYSKGFERGLSCQIIALHRAETLLEAAYKLLKKQEDAPYVIDLLKQTVDYDAAECSGSCLKDDIDYWFDEFSTKSLYN